MALDRVMDRALEWAKQLERRYYATDYEGLAVQARQNSQYEGYLEKAYSHFPDLKELRTVLVFKPDEIGDAICSLPALSELREALPKAHLSLVCQTKTRPLFGRTGIFDEIVDFPGRVVFRRFPLVRMPQLRRSLKVDQFDAAIFLRTYPSYFRVFKRLAARYLIHPKDPRLNSRSTYQPLVDNWPGSRTHQTLRLLQIVAPLIKKSYSQSEVKFPTFRWTDDDKLAPSLAFDAGAPEKYLVVHPFADFETRRYPYDYWVPLLHRLERHFGIPIVVVGAENDPLLDLSDQIRQVQGKLSLGQTGYLMQRAAAFIGNSSGPGHWAAALGRPTVTLMSGSSSPGEWAPLGDSLVLRTDVPCAPCHLRTCLKYGLTCLRALTPDRVFPEMEKFLSARIR